MRFLSEDSYIRVLGVMHYMSLMVIERIVEKIDREINFVRFGFLYFSGLEKFCKKESKKENRCNNTKNAKEIISRDKIEPFRTKKRF